MISTAICSNLSATVHIGSAREYFSPTAVAYKRNQYGGTVGGPIKKNKMFFFGGFQGTGIHQNPDNSITTVPTRAMMSGDWTTLCLCGMQRRSCQDLEGAFRQQHDQPRALFRAVGLYRQ